NRAVVKGFGQAIAPFHRAIRAFLRRRDVCARESEDLPQQHRIKRRYKEQEIEALMPRTRTVVGGFQAVATRLSRFDAYVIDRADRGEILVHPRGKANRATEASIARDRTPT